MRFVKATRLTGRKDPGLRYTYTFTHYLLLAILDVKCKSRDHNDLSLLSIHLLPTELYLKESCNNLTYKGLQQMVRTQQKRYRHQMETLQGHRKNSVICPS